MVKDGGLGETTTIGQVKEVVVHSIFKKYANKLESQKTYKRWISQGGAGRYDFFGYIGDRSVSLEVKAVGPRSGTANNKIAYFPYDIKCQVEDMKDAADISICVICPWTTDMVLPPNTANLIYAGHAKAKEYSTEKHKIIICMLSEFETILENLNAS